jgi:hypothetical protein
LVQLLTQIFAVGCKLCPTQDHTLANYRRQVRDIVEQVSSFTKTLDVRIWVAYIAAEASLGEFEEAKKTELIKELEKGEKSGFVENFERDSFLKNLHQKHKAK